MQYKMGIDSYGHIFLAKLSGYYDLKQCNGTTFFIGEKKCFFD